MRVVVVGLGTQGKKRVSIAGSECIATVDPFNNEASFREIYDVSLSTYDAALVCTPDESKLEILRYLLSNRKHVLVEKPLLISPHEFLELEALTKKHALTCYTAYNHRFEPHFVRMKQLLDSKKLGTLYYCRLFYGNGTARDVRNSPWRDKNEGVLIDLGSHLLDTLLFWFETLPQDFRLIRSHRFENSAPDHVTIGSEKLPAIELEMSLLSWRNHFSCDIIGEKGSAHIQSLCKWGPSTFIFRERKLPSGRPNEETFTLVQPDPTWEEEYRFFKAMCTSGSSNLKNDLHISSALKGLKK